MDTFPKYVHAMDTSLRRVHKVRQNGHILAKLPHRGEKSKRWDAGAVMRRAPPAGRDAGR